jgi:hypothetical protein
LERFLPLRSGLGHEEGRMDAGVAQEQSGGRRVRPTARSAPPAGVMANRCIWDFRWWGTGHLRTDDRGRRRHVPRSFEEYIDELLG